MNLAQLQASIQAKGYDSTTAPQQIIALNSIYRDTCASQRWSFLEKQGTIALTQGVISYPMSSIPDIQEVDGVRLEDPVAQQGWSLENMEPMPFRDIQGLDPNNLNQGTPQFWSMVSQNFMFYPVPDQAYTARVDYILNPPDLAVSTDVPVLPSAYHDLLVWGAIAEIAYRERDWLGRQFAQTEATTRLQHMRSEFQLRQRQTSSRVKRSGYWDTSRPSYPAITGW